MTTGGTSVTGEAAPDVERMMHRALDQTGTGMYLVDAQWRLLSFNEVGRSMMPDPAAVVVGGNVFDLHPTLMRTPFGDAILRAGNERIATTIKAYSERLQEWFDMSCLPAGDGIAVYCRNVTEEHETQERLAAADRRLRRKGALLDAASDAVYVRELDGTISYWNKGAERIYGWTSAEVLGKPASELLYPDKAAFEENAATVLREGQWIGVIEQTTRDGQTLQAHCRWQLASDDDAAPSFVLCMNSDLTDFKRKQDKTYRVQRLESLGTLAGGIAHDLNNVLTPILIAVQILQQDGQNDDNAELLQSIETSATRGADLIRQVLSFARGEEGKHSLVDIGELLEEVTDAVRDVLPKSIRVHFRVAPDLSPVMGDRTQILQILVNLITNARDAMPDGGTLTVSAGDRSPTGTLSSDGDALVVVGVEDTGSGMDDDTASRVFEPFFTTKEHGSGTGLGLSTSLAIARGHGGTIEVYSEPGKGSRFQLRLPAAAGTPSTMGDSHSAPNQSLPRGSGELVLVVDDEDAICTLTQKTLELHGYRTLGAENGLRATEVIHESSYRVDLVVTDMMMPVMDGAALIAHLHDHHPEMPVIAASGLTTNVEVAKGHRHSVRYFLPKPFTAAELLQVLHTVLRDTADSDGASADH